MQPPQSKLVIFNKESILFSRVFRAVAIRFLNKSKSSILIMVVEVVPVSSLAWVVLGGIDNPSAEDVTSAEAIALSAAVSAYVVGLIWLSTVPPKAATSRISLTCQVNSLGWVENGLGSPVNKLSDRSAIRKKVVFFAGSVWSWPRCEGEVGRDQGCLQVTGRFLSPGSCQVAIMYYYVMSLTFHRCKNIRSVQ